MQHDLGSATSFSGRQLSFEKGWKVSSTWKSWRLQMALESSLLRHRSPSPSLSLFLFLFVSLSLSASTVLSMLFYIIAAEPKDLLAKKKTETVRKKSLRFRKIKVADFFFLVWKCPEEDFLRDWRETRWKNARYLGQLDILDRCSECKIRRHFVSSLGSTDRIQVGEKKNYNKLLLNKYKGTCCLAWGFFS